MLLKFQIERALLTGFSSPQSTTSSSTPPTGQTMSAPLPPLPSQHPFPSDLTSLYAPPPPPQVNQLLGCEIRWIYVARIPHQMPPDFGGYMAAAAAVSAGYGNGYSPSSAAASTGPQHPAYKRPTGTAGASHPYQV